MGDEKGGFTGENAFGGCVGDGNAFSVFEDYGGEHPNGLEEPFLRKDGVSLGEFEKGEVGISQDEPQSVERRPPLE